MTKVRHVAFARDVSFQDTANRILNECNGDHARALVQLTNYVKQFPRLLDEAVTLGCSTALHRCAPLERAALNRELGRSVSSLPFERPSHATEKQPHKLNPSDKRAQKRAMGMAKTYGEILLNYTYEINGQKKALRDHIGTDIEQHGRSSLATGMSQVRNARYLIWVGEKAGDKLVGTLDPSIIQSLREQADGLEL